ncbi:hypothetical protein [Actinoplanes regularis]|uniref:hypothetical protein n=1 Tax=Actinoplanes regularis TaxID=52697 RepID=UPI0025570579|nr:hypothetical protein [Actinoplanes regularis]
MQVDELRERTNTAALAAMIAASNGAQVKMPDPDQIRRDFDRALAAPPEEIADPATYELKQALGLNRR